MNLVFLSSLAICYSSFLPAFPDCNNNGIDDTEDIATCNGDPDCSDCNGDGRPDECGVAIGCDAKEIAKLSASDADDDRLGVSVSLSGSTALVGAWEDDCAAGRDCGSAYVFRFNGTSWVEEQKLTASDASADDRFGVSVSLSGNTAFVGANLDDCSEGIDCGSVYIFRFDGTSWVEEQKLTASDSAAEDWFGYSVSVSSGTAIVGASRSDCAASAQCGSAYIFRFDGSMWIEEQKLAASDAARADFGVSVSVNEDTAIVGAMTAHCALGDGCGAVYVFDFDGITWVEEQKLVASDAWPFEDFGRAVALGAETIVVGARRDGCAAGRWCGAAYAFRFDGNSWVEEQKLTASDVAADGLFASSVSLSGGALVIGAPGDRCATGPLCGAVYVFQFDGATWIEAQKLTASNVSSHDEYGISVSASGDSVVAGAPGVGCASDFSSHCGSAYLVDFSGEDCNCDGEADSCQLIRDEVDDCNGNGIPDECEADCNKNRQPDQCDLVDGSSDDCNRNTLPDECDTRSGFSRDCNLNEVPDECEPDCNGNGIPDECDIAVGRNSDCNSNGIPDSCDLRDGTSVDIDGDGLIDDCDTFFPIPTVSEWGMAVLALLLLILAKVAFRRRILA